MTCLTEALKCFNRYNEHIERGQINYSNLAYIHYARYVLRNRVHINPGQLNIFFYEYAIYIQSLIHSRREKKNSEMILNRLQMLDESYEHI